MARVLMWVFASGGMLAVFDWVVAGLLAQADPANSGLAAQAHESPFLLVSGVVFMAIGLAIAYFSRPERNSDAPAAARSNGVTP